MRVRYEFDAVNKTNAAASSLLWDDTISAGLARVADGYGARVSDYRVTVRERVGGSWVTVSVIDGADVEDMARKFWRREGWNRAAG